MAVHAVSSKLPVGVWADEYIFEKYILTCAPSRIRTCAHGSGVGVRACLRPAETLLVRRFGPCMGRAWRAGRGVRGQGWLKKVSWSMSCSAAVMTAVVSVMGWWGSLVVGGWPGVWGDCGSFRRRGLWAKGRNARPQWARSATEGGVCGG